MSIKPIGIFDSGVGGTSIWTEINQLLPQENTLYLADSKNAPYGSKGKDAIIELSIKNTEYLLNQNCKIIVVACNTATTNAIDYLRATYQIPFIGIEPAIKPAALQTQTNAIGILATQGTLSSTLFSKTAGMFSQNVNIIEQVGEGIVELIESGKLHSPQMKSLLTLYIQPMLNANIDHLVLGCTHYPYLIPLLLDILPKHIKIIDSGEAVARQIKTVLQQNKVLNTQKTTTKHRFLTNGTPQVMAALLNNTYPVEVVNF